MSTILVLHNSLNATASATREMTSAFASQYAAHHDGAKIIERDLVANPVPHLGPELYEAQLGAVPANDHSAERADANLSDTLIAEVEEADVIAIGVPMYNFAIPSTLKSWIDHIVRARRTFAYVDGAPKGLLAEGKKVVLFVATGGVYSEGAAQVLDFAVPYLKTVLGFVGLTDITIVRAEKQAMPDLAITARADAVKEALALAS
jgi:FMN-dependent NADH-azoreductase